MILILSRSRNEPTTEDVIDWLEALGAQFFRLNAEDIQYPAEFNYHLSGEVTASGFTFTDPFTAQKKTVDFQKVKSVWYRRWTLLRQYDYLHAEKFTDDHRIQQEIIRYLHREIDALGAGIFVPLGHAHWFSHPGTARPSKIRMLLLAKEAGLEIPATMIATEKEELIAFKQRYGALITKNLGPSPLSLDLSRGDLAFYTSELEDELLAQLPDTFFPSLVQEHIPKAYEVRVFFLEGDFYAMAIFSQNDPQTQMDFRRYQFEKPNRYVPYKLPKVLEGQLSALMQALDLDTGSIDLIRASDGRFVFLEVNPVGQFGMVSVPCNYYLEKKVAERLVKYAGS